MPKLIRLYITQVLLGFFLSAVFVGLLLWFNIANLAHLIAGSDIGWIAVGMLFMFNGDFRHADGRARRAADIGRQARAAGIATGTSCGKTAGPPRSSGYFIPEDLT